MPQTKEVNGVLLFKFHQHGRRDVRASHNTGFTFRYNFCMCRSAAGELHVLISEYGIMINETKTYLNVFLKCFNQHNGHKKSICKIK